jgi:hypothetical protein
MCPIVGAVVLGVIALLALSLFGCWLVRRRRRELRNAVEERFASGRNRLSYDKNRMREADASDQPFLLPLQTGSGAESTSISSNRTRNSSTGFALTSSIRSRLSERQLWMLEKMIEKDVSSSTIETVVDSMLASNQDDEVETRLDHNLVIERPE